MIIAPDNSAPLVRIITPSDDAKRVVIDTNFTIEFNEAIKRGTGNVYLKNADGTLISTYDVLTSVNLSFVGAVLTINPNQDLLPDTSYQIEIESGAVTDLVGNSFEGLTGYNFTTGAAGYLLQANFSYWSKSSIDTTTLKLAGVTLIEADQTGTSNADGVISLDAVSDLDDADDGEMSLDPSLTGSADKVAADITLSDVIASLKLFLGLNLPDAYRSPYNYVAADLDANGKVELSDVISLLKVFLGLPVANTQAMEWVFVKDSDSPTDINGQSFDKDHATPPPITHDFSESAEVNIVGILRGDVDGSWIPPTAT
jgi:hypothetical protein